MKLISKSAWRYVGQVLLLAVLYWGLAYAGFKLAPSHAHVTAIWFPAGLGLAALMVYGLKLWPGTFFGAILFTQSLGVSWLPSIVGGIGDMLSSLVGAWILKRFCKFDLKMATSRDAISMILFGALFPTIFGGSIGTFSLFISGIATSYFDKIFTVWWLADMAGALTLAPLLIAFLSPHEKKIRRPFQRVELVTLLVSLCLVCWLLFSFSNAFILNQMLPSYAILGFVIWSAFRFDFRVTSSVVMIASIAAIMGSIKNLPDSDVTIRSFHILHLQILMSSLSSIGLILSATSRQQQNIAKSLRESMDRFIDSEARLGIAIEAAHMGTWTWDILEGKVQWSNNVEKIFGLGDKHFSGTLEAFVELILPEDRSKVQEAIDNTLTGKSSSYTIEHRITWPDGSIHWLEGKGRVFNAANGNPIKMTGVVTDITEQKQIANLRESLLLHEKEARVGAERSVQQRDDFLNVASHELKTPLTPVLMSIQIIKRQIEAIVPTLTNGDRILRTLEHTEINLKRFIKLVSNLLDVSRITAERMILIPENFSLSTLIEEVVDRFMPELERIGCKVNLHIEQGIVGDWDLIRMDQVFTNILTNAMKYGEGKSIEIYLTQSHNKAKLSIRDHGIGIAKDDISKIFGRFERIAPLKNYGGLGLGLYISKNIIQAHGGDIKVESEVGEGSTFIVELPLKLSMVA